MPYGKGRRSAPLSDREKVLLVASSTSLSDLKDVLPADRGLGAASEYPALLQYLVAIGARIWGAQRNALGNLADSGLWADLSDVYERRFPAAGPLPSMPPSARQQDAFVRRFDDVDTKLLERLSTQLTLSAMGLARALGNFGDDVDPDWANPSPRHVLIGDGTFTEPYSSVVRFHDEVTGEVHYLGSRARDISRVRHQALQTNAAADHKKRSGINHVNLLTSTEYGWVVLGCVQTLKGEVHGMRDVVKPVLKVLGNRVHTLVWDRVVQGIDIEQLMARHRVLTVNKSVAATGAPRVISDAEAFDRFEAGDPLPLGVSVYRTAVTPANPDGLEGVRGRRLPLHTVRCQHCDGHELWVDDGTIVEVERTGQRLLKVESATSVQALPGVDPATDHHTLQTVWELPCRATGELHLFHTTWRPRSSKRQPRSDYDRAVEAARVLPRGDERFRVIHGQRNQTESYNAWAKAALGTGAAPGRAMRLSARLQLLDFLATATLANALTGQHASHTRAQTA